MRLALVLALLCGCSPRSVTVTGEHPANDLSLVAHCATDWRDLQVCR